MEKVLLHSCCAPCSVYCIKALRQEGFEPTSLWYNPNIHPFTEYTARRDTLIEYGKTVNIEVKVIEEYGLRNFVKSTIDRLDSRCSFCYEIRLRTAAKYAADNGFKFFTTSLLISPYQNHELIKKIGEEMGKEYGVGFLYRDFRTGFREGQNEARETGLYMQKYCGCIFSEEERYEKKIKKDKERFA